MHIRGLRNVSFFGKFCLRSKRMVPKIAILKYFAKFSVNLSRLCPSSILCIGVSPPPHPFLLSPSLNLQTVQAPLFRHPPPPPLYRFFVNSPPLKVGFFSERPKHQSFLSLTPCYFLKVTKFFVKIF